MPPSEPGSVPHCETDSAVAQPNGVLMFAGRLHHQCGALPILSLCSDGGTDPGSEETARRRKGKDGRAGRDGPRQALVGSQGRRLSPATAQSKFATLCLTLPSKCSHQQTGAYASYQTLKDRFIEQRTSATSRKRSPGFGRTRTVADLSSINREPFYFRNDRGFRRTNKSAGRLKKTK